MLPFVMYLLVAASSAGPNASHPVPDPSLPNAKLIGMKFVGGDHDGFSVGWRTDEKGKTFVGLMPSKPNASPLPPDVARLVSGLIEAYEKSQKEKYPQFVSVHAKTYMSCLYCDDSLPFAEAEFRVPKTKKLKLNTPFLMKPGSAADFDYAVRLEWLRDGQLNYTSELIIANDKVRDVITTIPTIPPIAAPASERVVSGANKPSSPSTAGPYLSGWAACITSYAEPRLKTQTTDAIVDGAFVACFTKENDVHSAYVHDLGPEEGATMFEGIRRGVRGIMLRRVAQAKDLRGYK